MKELTGRLFSDILYIEDELKYALQKEVGAEAEATLSYLLFVVADMLRQAEELSRYD